MTQYVFEGLEVKKTGRIAQKEIPTKLKKRRGGNASPRIDILYEVTPVDNETGSWMKWVKDEDLYEIVDEDKPDND